MTAFAEYLAAIRKKLTLGDATEHTHRAALEHLLEAVGNGITATNEPKRIACGAPDFNITRNKVPIGHIETKDIGVGLDEMERGKGPNGDQFKRYREALPNWILTDYLEFRWFVVGEKRLAIRLAEIDANQKVRFLPDGEQQLANLLEMFFVQPALTVGTAKELATRMAGMTRNIRDLITASFAHGAAGDKNWLQNWLAAFREVLIPDLDEPQFADMFAQTLAYGLFAARVNTPAGNVFSREIAAFSLPKTNPFLRKLFAEFAGVDMPETFGWAVDDVVELLKHAAMHEVLKDFGKGKGKEDPVVHFYETFLTAYDPKTRELRGVYYTPEPVVSYIVRSIDHLLRTRFGRAKGLADENTLILDPATGTATFLYFVVRQIHAAFGGQRGAWDSYVTQHLLGRIFGFELLMAPYAVAHLKLGLELHDTGYSFGSDQRLGVYLTNTLEEAAMKSEKLIAKWISDEANEAAAIKRDKPILVILGNPPYSGHSANRSEVVRELTPGDSYKLISGGPLRQNKTIKVVTAKKAMTVREKTFIGDLIDDYKLVDGAPLGEKNPKWLQDDYVKFIRFAQWRIDRTGHGILGFITNHGYLDNPTFRGMRQSLMQSFSEIYVYNLHGNSKKKERAPDGSRDENVFDIQQGVTLGIFIKELNRAGPANVHHADVWGLREMKYRILSETDVNATHWETIEPQSPLYLFVPQEKGLRAEYERGLSLRESMLVNVLGFQTHRDSVAIGFTEKELAAQVAGFLGAPPSKSNWDNFHRKCSYRPFDNRSVYLAKDVTDRPRLDVTTNLFKENVALNLVRQTKAKSWGHVLVTRDATPAVFLEIKDGSSIFPLYCYHDPLDRLKAKEGESWVSLLPWPESGRGRRPNFNRSITGYFEIFLGLEFVSDGKGDLKNTFGPEDVFGYIYAVLYSPTYRERYAQFLKSDFPRLPITSDRALFAWLVEKGSELVALHLMVSPRLDNLITTFPEKGSNIVEKVTYVDSLQRVSVNGIQYFQGVPRDAWQFHIGGYQVLEKWLKDRTGRELTWDDIQHYQKIVVALKETIRLMAEIDAAIPKWPIE